MNKWFKNNMPGTYKFFADFFEAMSNKKEGHSLRKWLAVGFYWIMFEISIRYTDSSNLEAVLLIHAGMITTLVITYTTSNVILQKKEKTENSQTNTEETDGKA